VCGDRSLVARLERVEAVVTAPAGEKVIVVGEGLIDFIPGEDGRFMPRCGGAPFNVCLAMARLDAPTAFLSNVSTDMFGDQICAELARKNCIPQH
jgi:fructokinase